MSRTDKFTCLITGASSGLGLGMAREFAKLGHNLALCARRTDKLDELKAELSREYPNIEIETRALDVNNHEQISTVFKDFHAHFSKLDRIIVNAGVGFGAPVGKGGFPENLKTLNTNLISAFAQSEVAMEIFREQKEGHLVFMSSMSALRGLRGSMTAYSVSKSAVATLGQGIEMECRKFKNIDVSTIFPGYIRTEINADIPRSKTPFIIPLDEGSTKLAKAIESRKSRAFVPWWPWRIMAVIIPILPTWLAYRLT